MVCCCFLILLLIYLFYIEFYCPLHFTVAHLKLIFKNNLIIECIFFFGGGKINKSDTILKIIISLSV